MSVAGSGISRLGDFESGHGCWFPVPVVSSVGTVLVNKLPAASVGDVTSAHVCPKKPPHIDQISKGSAKIFVNKCGQCCVHSMLLMSMPSFSMSHNGLISLSLVTCLLIKSIA